MFAYCGRYSMSYLCLNQLVITITERIVSRRGITEQILLTISALIFCTIINEVGLRMRANWNIYGLLFGR